MAHRSDPRNPQSPRPRTEPVLGNLDRVDAGDAPAPRAAFPDHRDAREPKAAPALDEPRVRIAPVRRSHRGWWTLLVVIALLALAGSWAWDHQPMLTNLFPQTRLNTLLTRADSALAAGNLTGGPQSARDLYEAVRALDPDNDRALAGLRNVGNAELRDARTALARHDLDHARISLEEARSLLGGGDAVTKVDHALAAAVLHSANVNVLLSEAAGALANGRVDGSDGAAALYRKVLAGDPGNPVASQGMNQVGNVLTISVQTQLSNDDIAGAQAKLATLTRLLPDYSQLPSLRAAVAAAERRAQQQRDQDLAGGEAALRAGHLTGAGDNNALALFKAALAIDPANARAKAGIGQVAAGLTAKADAAVTAGNTAAAKALLEQASALAPKSADIVTVRSRLAATLIVKANAAVDAGDTPLARTLLDEAGALAPQSANVAAARSRLAGNAGKHAGRDHAPAAALSPAQTAKVARLVARARAAAAKGDIMLPPGSSAYDLYRAALGIDGNNAAAQTGLRGLPGITRQAFRSALHGGDLERAHDMLATLDQLDPGDPVALTMRRDLGSAWLDRADADVTKGRLAAARTALEQARTLVPSDPRLTAVDARIGQAH